MSLDSAAMFRGGPGRTGWYPGAIAADPAWAYDAGGWIKSSPVIAAGTGYVASLTGTVHAVDLATGRARWTRPIGAGIDCSPAVAGGTVYLGAAGGEVVALDAGTGAVRWRVSTGDEGSTTSPAVAGGLVLVGGPDHRLLGLDAGTGERRWAYPTGARLIAGDQQSPPARGALLSSPLVVDRTVYLSDGELHALALETGRPLWTATAAAGNACSAAAGAGLLFVAELGSFVRAVEAGTGRSRWRVEVPAALFRFGTPAVADGLLVVCAERTAEGDGPYGFQLAGGLVAGLDADTGTHRWRREFAGRVLSAPALADGQVHLVECGEAGSTVVTLDAATGTEVRRRALPGSGDPGHSFVSSPSVSGGTLYVGTVDGQLLASNVDSDGFTAAAPSAPTGSTAGSTAGGRRWWRRRAAGTGSARPGSLSERDRARLRKTADQEAARALAGLRERDRSGRAVQHSLAALAAIERLYADDPDNWVNAEQLAGKLYNHAALLDLVGRPDEGAEAAQASITYYAEAAGGRLPDPATVGAQYAIDQLRHRFVPATPDALRPSGPEFAMLAADASARLALLLAKSQGNRRSTEIRQLTQYAVTVYEQVAKVNPRHEQDLFRVAALAASALRHLGDGAS
jgi:outer membrane protein assembly factor BamB